MKYLWIFFFSLVTLSLEAQGTFTEAYTRFSTYHYQTPQAWNRIRREVATHGKEKWPFIKTKPVEMSLAGLWQGLVPAPTRENTYFFKEVDDMGKIYDLMLTPNTYGYAIYPFKLEEQFKLSENKLLASHIKFKGFMNTLITDVPYETEKKLDEIVYSSDSTQNEENTLPESFDENGQLGWISEAESYDLYNVKNFYCYFDNRPDSVRNAFKYVTRVTAEFGAEVENLKRRMQSSDLSYLLIPYWMTDVYLQAVSGIHSEPEIKRYGYLGYVINPITGTPELTNNWNSLHVMDMALYKNKSYDLVAYCGDAVSTNRFLTNKQAQHRFIHSILSYPDGMINRKDSLHKPNGLNLYLPKFDFSEKRALTQLVKSLSLVLDSLNVKGTHVYKDLDLSLTFSREAASKQSGYISGLQCFVDTVYFADFDSLGLASTVVYNDGSIDTSSVVTRVTNPFYLFRIPFKTIQSGVNDGDIWQLMDCDYASGRWGLFFCVDLCLVLLLLALIVLRYTSVMFNMYVQKYYTFIVLLTITLVMELVVFFFFMIEALSPQVIYFNFDTGNFTYLALIALPILPIVFYLLILKLNKREPVP